MDFIEKIKDLAKRIEEQKKVVATEQAAKTSMVMPFLQLMGYDVFNASEVIPEYIADWGAKKGEKVDYAIKVGGKFVMLIECKPANDKLDASKESQLARYFTNIPEARIGMLTNGIIYKFYTDLNEPNIMDVDPFLVFDFSQINERIAMKLEMFTKEKITNTDSVTSDIVKLRNYSATSEVVFKELSEPSDELIRHIIKQLPFKKIANEAALAEFRIHVKKAIEQFEHNFFDEQIRKLQEATKTEENEQKPLETQPEPPRNQIITTVQEYQALSIVKTILFNIISSDKVGIKDFEGYCNIVYKVQGSPCIIRLFFNEAEQGKLYISFPANEEYEKLGRMAIKDIDSINNHSEKIIATVKKLMEQKDKSKGPDNVQ